MPATAVASNVGLGVGNSGVLALTTCNAPSMDEECDGSLNATSPAVVIVTLHCPPGAIGGE